jgi:methanogenic corrinoid protein MtbC1
VVVPIRSEGGQRLYSDLDVERLRLLRRLTLSGHAISRIANLPTDALTQLDAVANETGSPQPTDGLADDSLHDFTESALRATRRLDHWTLQTLLERAAITLGAPDFLDHVAAPTLDEIGRGWAAGTVSVAQEHLATAVFRRVLGWLLGVYEVKDPAPRLLVATPAGEMHELGALMVAVAAAAEGWYVTYLGPDLPVDDLLEAASASGATAVALSVVHALDFGALLDAIRRTREGLPAGTPLLLGGAAASGLGLDRADNGVMLVESLEELRLLLGRLAGGAAAEAAP